MNTDILGSTAYGWQLAFGKQIILTGACCSEEEDELQSYTLSCVKWVMGKLNVYQHMHKRLNHWISAYSTNSSYILLSISLLLLIFTWKGVNIIFMMRIGACSREIIIIWKTTCSYVVARCPKTGDILFFLYQIIQIHLLYEWCPYHKLFPYIWKLRYLLLLQHDFLYTTM